MGSALLVLGIVAAYAVFFDDALRALVRSGWLFTYPTGEDGRLTIGLGARFYPGGWWDGIVIHDKNECQAMRVNPADETTWVRHGRTVDMALAVAELPAPGEHLAPALTRGKLADALEASAAVEVTRDG